MSFHRACCCGPVGPLPGCADYTVCDACGRLAWSVTGTLIRDIFGAGGGFLQRQVWSIQTLDIVTLNRSVTGRCRWLNNFAQSGSNDDFISFSGTYVLQVAGAPVRSATNFVFTAPVVSSSWGVDSSCDPVTFEEMLEITVGTGYSVPDDQSGTSLDVSIPIVLQFIRLSNRDCPIGTFNMIDPSAGTIDYPSLPILESVPE